MDTPDVPMISKSQLAGRFRALGVTADQVVMLHASVKTIGWLLGGPLVVLEALIDVIGPRGTLMMLASWEGNPYRMERLPQAHRAACLADCPALDAATSPADHRELSILSEYLRTWPGAYRSNHPLASFVAVRPHAHSLTVGHPLQYPHGPEAPSARLCAADGAIVLLGTSFSTLTLLHHAEHLASLPTKRIDRYQMPMLQNEERVWVDIEEFDTTDGIADFGSEDYFLEIGQRYVAAGKGQVAQVGRAPSFLFKADDLKQFAIQWMEANYKGPFD